MTLWTRTELEQALGIPAFDLPPVTGISIDTRTLEKGNIFVALTGQNVDGHQFIEDAFAKGASAVISSQQRALYGVLHVADTYKALLALARFARSRHTGQVIGVTGSVGKSGTTRMLALGFQHILKTHASSKSHNNQFGVPLSLASLPRDAEIGIFEMGMDKAGEMAFLTDLVQPTLAAITTIAPAHLKNFSGLDAIATAKAEIFRGLCGARLVILPRDSAQYPLLRAAAEQSGAARILTFGEHASADVRLVAATVKANTMHITADACGAPAVYTLPLVGQHGAVNSLIVLAALTALNLPLTGATQALANYTVQEGRGLRHKLPLPAGSGTYLLIDESYNANPVSMAAALSLLGQATGRKIAVLADMLEMGANSPALHADLKEPLQQHKVDVVFLHGTDMQHLATALKNTKTPIEVHYVAHRDDLYTQVQNILQNGDTVMIKGSNGMKLSGLVKTLLVTPRAA